MARKSVRKNKETGAKKRIFWLDVLRVVAIFAVVTVHVATQNWDKIAAGTEENVVLAVFDAVARFAVPIFVMISGALMLGREISLKKCLKKIGKLAIVWVFWCLFYAGMTLAMGKGTEAALKDLAFGHFHMWFLPMIAALYLITPALKWISKNQRWCVVVIIVLLVISVALRLRWTAYPMFYLMGYILGNGSWVRGKRKKYALIGAMFVFLASTVAAAALNIRASIVEGVAVRPYDADWSIFVIMQAVAIFSGVKLVAGEQPKKGAQRKIFAHLAGDVLGVYMVHIVVLGALNKIGISDVMLSGVVGTICGTVIIIVLTTGLSIGIVEIIRKIPLLKNVV